MASQPIETKITYCRVCMVTCGLEMDLVGEQIVKVRGDFNHPLTKGYTCPKGRAMGQIHHLPERDHSTDDAQGWRARRGELG